MRHLSPAEWLSVASALAGLIAAGFAWYASTVVVHDNLDTLTADLARQSLWNGRAALATVIAAVLVLASNALLVFARQPLNLDARARLTQLARA